MGEKRCYQLWTPEREATLVRGYLAGLSWEDIGHMCGCTGVAAKQKGDRMDEIKAARRRRGRAASSGDRLSRIPLTDPARDAVFVRMLVQGMLAAGIVKIVRPAAMT